MATPIPKPPVGLPVDSPQWYEWFRKIQAQAQNPSNVTWASLDFTGSNITNIVNRAHNNLQSIQGGATGEYYHLDNVSYTFFNGMRKLSGSGSLDFTSIAANSCQELTFTLTGVQINDTILVGPPANIPTGLVWSVYVSATDTIKLRMCNVTTGAIDPPAGTWKFTAL